MWLLLLGERNWDPNGNGASSFDKSTSRNKWCGGHRLCISIYTPPPENIRQIQIIQFMFAQVCLMGENSSLITVGTPVKFLTYYLA